MTDHKDYDESETKNLFGDDYITAELFDEEDEEIGTDFHELELGNPKLAESEIKNYGKKTKSKRRSKHIEDLPDNLSAKKERILAKLPAKWSAKGYITVVIETADKIVILK